MKEIESYFNLPMLMLASILSVLSTITDNYLFADWSSIITMMLALFVDFCLAVALAIKRKEFQWSKIGLFSVKVGVYFSVLFIVHAAVWHEKNETIKDIAHALNNGIFWAFLIHELFSILKNARAIGVQLPKKVEDTLNKFGNNGTFGI